MNQIEQLEWIVRLWHVSEAASSIIEFVADRTFEEYENNEMLRLAVERQLITVGEALSRAIKADPAIEASITDPRGIIGCRNRLIHNYPEVSNETVWRIIHEHLPRLLTETRALLAAAPAGENPA